MPSEDSPPRRVGSSSPSRLNPWSDHNPWEQEDTHEAQGLGIFGGNSPSYPSVRTYTSPNGRFSFSSATLDPGTPSGQRNNGPNPMVPMMMQSFDTLLQSLLEPNPRGYRGLGEDPFHPQSSTAPDWLEDDHLTGHHPGLSPRNADAPQSVNQNPMTITEYVTWI